MTKAFFSTGDYFFKTHFMSPAIFLWRHVQGGKLKCRVAVLHKFHKCRKSDNSPGPFFKVKQLSDDHIANVRFSHFLAIITVG